MLRTSLTKAVSPIISQSRVTLLTCTLLYVTRKTSSKTCASRMSTFRDSWSPWGRKSSMPRISSKIELDHSTEIRKVPRREPMHTLAMPPLLLVAMNLNLYLSQGWIHLWCTRGQITHLPDVVAVWRVSKTLLACCDKTLEDPTLQWNEVQLSLPTIADPSTVVALYRRKMRTPLLKVLLPRIMVMPILNRRSRLSGLSCHSRVRCYCSRLILLEICKSSLTSRSVD